jgi:diguanylate cyclase (GGDEF)-like protein/PAS domain S-box-containing protein
MTNSRSSPPGLNDPETRPTLVAAVLQRNSLKTRITIATLLIFIAGIWSLSFYATRILRKDVEQLVAEQQFSAVSMVAAQVDRELYNRLETLKAVAHLSSAAMQQGPAAMQRFLENRHDLLTLFTDGSFATRSDGTAIAAAPFASVELGTNFIDRDYLISALHEGQTTIGRPLFGRSADAPVVVMATPIRDSQGKIIGALAGVTNLGASNFLDQVTEGRFGKTGGYLLIAPQHRLIITASDKTRALEPLSTPGLDAMLDQFAEGREGSLVANGPLGVEVLYSAKKIPSADWRTVVFLPTEEAFFLIRDLQKRMRLAALLLTLLAGALTWLVLRRQLSPLLATAKTLAALTSSSDAEPPRQVLPIARPDEIGQLIAGFNSLLETLAKRESALRESEEHFRLIFENSGEAILFSLKNGQIDSANPAACRLLGYGENELLQLNLSAIIDDNDPRLPAAIDERRRSGRFYGELRAVRRDGRVLDVDVNSTCFTDSNGITNTLNQLRDISERKLAVDAIRISEARLRRAELDSKSGHWELHLESQQMVGSEGTATLLGFDKVYSDFTEIRGIVLPEYHPMLTEALKRLIEDDEPYDLELKIRTANDGKIKDVRSTAQYDREKGVVFGVIRDIVVQKQNEARLQLAADVFTHVREGIMITDADGVMIEVNDAFTRISGFERAEAIGQNPRILKSDRQSPEFYRNMWESLSGQGHWTGELWNRQKSGELYAARLTISAVRDSVGRTQNYVGLFTDITKMKELQKQLVRVAHYDALTNLPNRVLLADRLQQAITQCHRSRQSLAVVYLDLDDFKAVNDQYGHGVGDDLLVVVSQRMRDALREGDTLSRIGGDEFVAVLTNLNDPQDCKPALDRLLLAAASPVILGETTLQVSVSLGVTLYPQDGADADLLLRHADQALYLAKQSGRNRYHLFDVALDAAVSTQREGLQHIREALEGDQFILYYQPKVNMRTGEVIGVEALIRWQHAERGLLPPAAFLPLIENHALTVDIGEWVIDSALTQMALWRRQGLEIPVSVNVSAHQLQQADFVERLGQLLARHPSVRPGDLQMEVLETSALEDLIRVSQVIDDCRHIGVNFALDDFGTGYSSLTYLKRLPVSLLKIDQSFVRDMLEDPDDLAILEGVIGLASAFRREVIAEGVETIEHGKLLLQLGCELAQGYVIAHPMPAAEIPGWASAWRTDPEWLDRPPVDRDDMPLLFARIEHRAWATAMEKHLTDDTSTAPPLSQCRFCTWIDNKGLAQHADLAEFQAVEAVHRKARALAAKFCDLHDQGRQAEVVSRLGELHSLTDSLLSHLSALQNKLPAD